MKEEAASSAISVAFKLAAQAASGAAAEHIHVEYDPKRPARKPGK